MPLRLVPQTVSRVGDLVDLLQLTKDQQLFAPQTVTTQQVIDERSGGPVASDREAEVLLLGDSFTNIYSTQGMGWGTGAGFGQHLAYHLQRPIDVIAFNGGAATRPRGARADAERRPAWLQEGDRLPVRDSQPARGALGTRLDGDTRTSCPLRQGAGGRGSGKSASHKASSGSRRRSQGPTLPLRRGAPRA